jgi:hypothetical protein
MEFTKYLFCYFTGNLPDEERIHFAVSDDGYNYTCVNSGKPVIIQTKGKKCRSDPFILRDLVNIFHIIATDLIDFAKVDESNFSLNHLIPRHGSVLQITEQECELLKNSTFK